MVRGRRVVKKRQRRRRRRLLLALIILVLISALLLFMGLSVKKAKEAKEAEIEAAKPKPISLVATGDILVHDPIYEEAYNAETGSYDFKYIFEEVKPLIEPADLAFTNVETLPVAGDEIDPAGYPAFATPKEIINDLIYVGFNMFSLANNHSLDKGYDALGIALETMSTAAASNQIMYSGLNTSAEMQQNIPVIEINNTTISFIAFTDFLNTGSEPDPFYAVNYYTPELAAELVAKADSISDVQIVSMHWGKEGSNVPSESQEEIANYLASLGVDIILGHHPHVIQPTELINNGSTLVIYSMGNFIAAQENSENQIGGIYTINFLYDEATDKVIFNEYSYIPTFSYYTCLETGGKSGCWNNFKVKVNSDSFYIGDYSPQYEEIKEVVMSDPNIIFKEYP